MSRVHIPAKLRQQVIQYAAGKCEYCLIHQDDTPYTHHIDHVLPLKHGGQTILENLALACLDCNRYKGSDLSTIDPVNEEITPLFNPRTQAWTQHFLLQGVHIIGQTPIGRATSLLLRFNTPERLLHRRMLIRVGRYPG
jgi:5-methylcytosine-specific restriction endonuclease McrA